MASATIEKSGLRCRFMVYVFLSPSNSPQMQLFTGAIGSAYHLLYEPLMPLKDELNYIMSESDPKPTTESLPL